MKIISDSGLDRDDLLLVCRRGDNTDLQEVTETRCLRLLKPGEPGPRPGSPKRTRLPDTKSTARRHVPADSPCGDCGVDTKKRYLEILEFTHFVEFFSFNRIAENHKEKELVRKVTVVVALDLGCGNTKNSEYESK